ncbi:MAG: CHRD domain-containing protein, partial [Betaproteobacteria bacterium]
MKQFFMRLWCKSGSHNESTPVDRYPALSRNAVSIVVLALAVASSGCVVAPLGSSLNQPISVPRIQTSSLSLSGAEEVPPVATSALGTGSFEIPADHSISGSIATTGINATAAHIHVGAVGRNGPVVVALTRSGD